MKSSEYMRNIKTLIDAHGVEETLTICEEEASELIKALTKYRRARSHSEQMRRKDEALEEMADVVICVDMLMTVFGVTERELEKEVKKKMGRNLKRIC